MPRCARRTTSTVSRSTSTSRTASPAHPPTAEQLLQKAGIAMQVAAKRGLPWFVYETRADATSRENLTFLGAMSAAVQRNELTLWHQAKTSLASGQVAGTEALIRWHHPEHGLVMPGRFMPHVEASTLID